MSFFDVKFPQLEHQPGEGREGLKRYNFNKNMNSYEFPIVSKQPTYDTFRNLPNNEINSAVLSPEVARLKQQLLHKQLELEKLKSIAEGPSKSYNSSPAALTYPDSNSPQPANKVFKSSYDYNLFEIAKMPAFQQQKFTKRNPKIVATNTITGYAFSPDKSLGHYGNMIMSNKLIG